MRRARCWLLAIVAGLLTFAAPAAAHESRLGANWLMESSMLQQDPRPGWYTPSPTSQSANMAMLGDVYRSKPVSTYRNSDLAFWGRWAYAGHYDGFQIVDLANPSRPRVVTDYDCPGSQHDVSVWGGRLLFVSVETPRSGPGCDSVTQSPGFEGIRIFDVSMPGAPSLIAGVPTDCGSHTHTLVPDLARGRVLLYVASYTASEIAVSPFGNECRRFEDAERTRPAHNKISVVAVPLRDPAAAEVISEPRIPQNSYRSTPGFMGCHDITVFPAIDRAASACMGEGQLWDISDKANPKTIARIHNPNVEFFHSATFSADGERVVFGDEAGGGTQPRCRSTDPMTLGALWFYDVDALDNMDSSTVEPWRSSFKVPRPQDPVAPNTTAGNCTMHNFNVLPLRSRDVLVSSAYAAGTTVVDFTNASRPREIGHLDPQGANTWSSYWYDGEIVTNDSGRGVDVMDISHAAVRGARAQRYSNPQTQDFFVDRSAGEGTE